MAKLRGNTLRVMSQQGPAFLAAVDVSVHASTYDTALDVARVIVRMDAIIDAANAVLMHRRDESARIRLMHALKQAGVWDGN